MSDEERRRRTVTALGWIAGGALGLLLNYALFLAVGEGYPTVPTTFVAFTAGAFGGMGVADRMGTRAFRLLGVTAGILLALLIGLVLAVALSTPSP